MDEIISESRQMEPGLALMDEIGRRALTNAFINFIRDPSNPSSYRDSLIYHNVRTSRLESDSNEADNNR